MTQKVQSSTVATASPERGLHIALWVAQALLAVGFGMAGLMKLTTPYQQLVSSQAWAQSMPEALLRFIGLSEVAGALGVILPAATRIKPILTPIAAVGLVIIMILAAGVHLLHGEPPLANVVLGALAALVAWGRLKRVPILSR
ncbi:MAG: DoxX family protein [Myxococcales bacterium]|nr:DoxX family protein [Myxococcales bacterium]